MRILIIDNYDSFVYNIVQLIHKIDGVQLDVLRNDDERLCEIEHYDAIIISPGPGVPNSAGRLMEAIKRYHTVIPMLGICLGFQAIAQFFCAKLINLQRPLHGHESELTNVDLNDRLYQSIQQPIIVGHYHSWVVDGGTLPACLKATAYDESENLMSFTHRSLPIYGVQYHPESIITNSGTEIINNFIASVAK
jgi:anthranilate synthase component 2